MEIEITKAITPKKLWLLRLYVKLINVFVQLILTTYIIFTIINTVKSNSEFIGLVLGYFGFYLVWTCLAVLIISEVISLFINIHDNIEVVRNKTIDPNFVVDLDAEKEKNKETSIISIITIVIIVLSIIFSFANL